MTVHDEDTPLSPSAAGRWTERQHALLTEMGLRLWAPVPTATAPDPAALPVAPPSKAEAPSAPPVPVQPAPVPVAVLVQAAIAIEAAGEPSPAAARPLVATLDWPALQAAVADCRACALCESRTQTVFGTGHPQAHWMVIGEAPGEQEDRLGEPFVGVSGQLLDRMLTALGLTRGEAPPERSVYIANTLKCRPPRNRNPAPEELLRCEAYLQRQIALVQPKMILAMGRFAVQTLLRSSEPVGRLRGRVHRYEGVPLVVTYHPAYLLRSPGEKARAWDDLCLAAEVAEAAQEGQGPGPSLTAT